MSKSHIVDADPLGIQRVLEPKRVLPQQAKRLRVGAPFATDELVVAVDRLCVDAASFRQMLDAASTPEGVGARVLEIVAARGKLHNPDTNSGGMLLGTVERVGATHPGAGVLAPGMRIATLASLTLTPLELREVHRVDVASHQIEVSGTAVVVASAPYVRMPGDLDEHLVLAAMDVCGAAPLALRWATGRQSALIMGAGMSGCLVASALFKAGLHVTVADIDGARACEVVDAGFAHAAVVADALDALAFRDAVARVLPNGADIVVNVVDIGDTEVASILCAAAGAVIVFLSMGTLFQRAALVAEGLGADVTMLIGNGFVQGHAEATLAQLRAADTLRSLLLARIRR